MAQNIQQIRASERLVRCIHELLENQEAADDASWWTEQEAQRRLRELSVGGDSVAVTSDELGFSAGEQKKLVFASFRGQLEAVQTQLRAAVARLASDEDIDRIQLVLLVEDMKNRITLEHAFDRRACQEMADDIRKEIGRKKRLRISRACILLKSCPAQHVRLTGLRRRNMLLEPEVEETFNLEPDCPELQTIDPNEYDAPVRLQSLVFTVDLYQLAELYNQVGDQLFQNNVRFGIEETMGVEQSIRRTLLREPWHFLWKNGGITLLVEEGEATDVGGCTDELILGRLSPESVPSFSVVNGAQTITTAARFFYELAYRKEHGNPEEAARCGGHFETARRHARVLVRVIQIPRDEQAKRLANEISVSLNRQKPIRMEDIAYTAPAVDRLTEYLRRAWESRQVPYQLTRRGEDAEGVPSIKLIDFVRARVACAGAPGDARSKGSSELLRTEYQEDGSLGFRRKDLFSPDWLEETDVQAVFRRDYGGVWFAHQAAAVYEKVRRTVRPEDAEALAVVSNGKWYFAAALANRFLEDADSAGSRPNFSRFSASFEAIWDKLPAAIPLFARLTVLCAHAYLQNKNIDSNLFKTNDLYSPLCQALRGRFSSRNSGWNQEAGKLAEQLAALLGFPEVSAEPAPSQRVPPFPGAEGVQNLPLEQGCVVINGEILNVQTGVQALVQVVTYVLSTYSIEPEKLERLLGSWLTRNEEKARKKTGSFRQYQKLKLSKPGAPEEPIWLATSTSSNTKRDQMKALCHLAGVPRESLCWYQAKEEKPQFVW